MAIDTKVLKRPVTARVNEFDEFASRMLSYNITEAKLNNQKSLPVVIDSYGGEAYSLMGMVDLLTNSGLDIITIATSKAMSCGAFLLAIGKKRYATPKSTIMIHAVRSTMRGDLDSQKNEVNQLEKLNNMAFELLDTNTNKPSGFWLNKLAENNNNDLYLSAQEALNLGLITNIGTPELTDIFNEDEIKMCEKEGNNFDDLRLLLSHENKSNINHKEIFNLIQDNFQSKNINNDKNEQKQGGTMDLNKVLGKLSEDEKKPITALQNELISAKQDVEIKSKELETKINEIKALSDNHAKVIADFAKKSDNDFIDTLIASKKLSLAEKNDELEILANLPEAVKAKHKAKLLAKSAVVQGEVPSNGESGFDGGELSYKAKLEKVAKKYNLDLKKQSDLAEAQILEAKGGY